MAGSDRGRRLVRDEGIGTDNDYRGLRSRAMQVDGAYLPTDQIVNTIQCLGGAGL